MCEAGRAKLTHTLKKTLEVEKCGRWASSSRALWGGSPYYSYL